MNDGVKLATGSKDPRVRIVTSRPAARRMAQAPDVIVTPCTSISQCGPVRKLLAIRDSAAMPAACNKRVVVMDDLLQGFGPRRPEALAELMAGFGGKAVGDKC
ncbi:MAG TPA: hypothetical protein VLC08_05960 [Chitinolyticbacter sp.]|nr:hypothetical protein [Chitinolyticbacter sp.]